MSRKSTDTARDDARRKLKNESVSRTMRQLVTAVERGELKVAPSKSPDGRVKANKTSKARSTTIVDPR